MFHVHFPTRLPHFHRYLLWGKKVLAAILVRNHSLQTYSFYVMCRLVKIMIVTILKQIILQECQFYCLLIFFPLLQMADYLVYLKLSQICIKVRIVDSCMGQFWKINFKWMGWRKKFTSNIFCWGLAMPSLILIRAKSTMLFSQIKHLKYSFLNIGKRCNNGIIKQTPITTVLTITDKIIVRDIFGSVFTYTPSFSSIPQNPLSLTL